MFVAKLYTGTGSAGTEFSYLSYNEPYIYPNPASSLLNVESGSQITITVYDLSGHIVLSPVVADEKAAIDVNMLPRGLYIVGIIDNTSGQGSKLKFVKR